ncbi:hypothetical protein NE237_001704 [Protea cynaroides]|uniref:Uncharacterized protein n=1 Tax=Protea cynaroides TaxID=273540 RepID=A0A9Q0KTM7_9MAGN|nr:hypothetical protein NE237_001704 [Protea cynaroides]
MVESADVRFDEMGSSNLGDATVEYPIEEDVHIESDSEQGKSDAVEQKYATEHRCGVVVKGPKLSGNISGTDPLKDNRLLLKVHALDGTDEAKHTAAVVNELSKELSKILVSHPLNAKRAAEGKNIANVVLLRGCGIRIEVSCLELLKQCVGFLTFII